MGWILFPKICRSCFSLMLTGFFSFDKTYVRSPSVLNYLQLKLWHYVNGEVAVILSNSDQWFLRGRVFSPVPHTCKVR
jgi:hypothetical protein